VRARNRDWVVLPSDDDDMLRLRPLGGTDEDAVGVYLPLEGGDVRSATLAPPDAEYLGDASSAALLRDAVLRVVGAAGTIGVRTLLVHAISDEAKAFYEHWGFRASMIAPMTSGGDRPAVDKASKSGSQLTHRWRGEPGANPSLNRSIPGGSGR